MISYDIKRIGKKKSDLRIREIVEINIKKTQIPNILMNLGDAVNWKQFKKISFLTHS